MKTYSIDYSHHENGVCERAKLPYVTRAHNEYEAELKFKQDHPSQCCWSFVENEAHLIRELVTALKRTQKVLRASSRQTTEMCTEHGRRMQVPTKRSLQAEHELTHVNEVLRLAEEKGYR